MPIQSSNNFRSGCPNTVCLWRTPASTALSCHCLTCKDFRESIDFAMDLANTKGFGRELLGIIMSVPSTLLRIFLLARFRAHCEQMRFCFISPFERLARCRKKTVCPLEWVGKNSCMLWNQLDPVGPSCCWQRLTCLLTHTFYLHLWWFEGSH